MQGTGCEVTLSGGVSKAGPALVSSFEATLKKIDRSCVIVAPKLSPAGGALLLAYDLAGLELDAGKMDRFLGCAMHLEDLCP